MNLLQRNKEMLYINFKVGGWVGRLDMISVTWLGDLLHFGQFFKACGNNKFPKSPIFLGNFYKDVKIFHFSIEIIFGQLL